MRRLRGPLRVAIAWTLVLLAVGVLLALQAMSSLYDAQQACFFTADACPASDDPAVGRLTFAFIGVPLVWLAGIGVVAVVSVRRRRRGA
jgi:hypothetical protein